MLHKRNFWGEICQQLISEIGCTAPLPCSPAPVPALGCLDPLILYRLKFLSQFGVCKISPPIVFLSWAAVSAFLVPIFIFLPSLKVSHYLTLSHFFKARIPVASNRNDSIYCRKQRGKDYGNNDIGQSIWSLAPSSTSLCDLSNLTIGNYKRFSWKASWGKAAWS